MTTQYVIIVNG